jgi:two-component system, LytTR family, response regulator
LLRTSGHGPPNVSTAPITALIVDDERLARERLRTLLAGEPDVDIVGECANGLEALAQITELNPELVFLDVQMPDLDGLGVITALGADETPEIIFVTAHSTYMERAFEMHAIDYLRKPYSNARFMSAMDHARRRIGAKRAQSTPVANVPEAARSSSSRFDSVLAALHDVNNDPRIALRDGKTGTWHLVSRDDIDWIGADGSARVRVHIGKESYVLQKTLAELENALDPRAFLRVHRSYIVGTAHIRYVKPLLKGEYAIVLTDGTILDSGRTYRAAVELFLHERAEQLAPAGEAP